MLEFLLKSFKLIRLKVMKRTTYNLHEFFSTFLLTLAVSLSTPPPPPLFLFSPSCRSPFAHHPARYCRFAFCERVRSLCLWGFILMCLCIWVETSPFIVWDFLCIFFITYALYCCIKWESKHTYSRTVRCKYFQLLLSGAWWFYDI